MAFCSSCGIVVQEQSQFCSSCGASVGIKNQNEVKYQSTQYEMNIVNAFKRVVFENYANFSGRASKAEYWWYILAVILVSIGIGVVDAILQTSVLSALLNLALFIPGLAVAVRRLHDTNKSGWWYLIALTGIGLIVLLFWFIQKSDQIENRFGPVPSV